MLDIVIKDEPLHLLPQRALYRPKQKTLYIADPHWGKTATFRANHIPLPQADIHHDLRLLTASVRLVSASRLVILGDLTHSKHSFEPLVVAAVEKWRADNSALQVDLVIGNHDEDSVSLPPSWNICILPHLSDDAGFLLSHKPVLDARDFVFCGHLHPTWKLYGRGRQTVTLPSFVQTAQMLVFPAFSHFTGSTTYRFDNLRHVYGITKQRVIQIL